MADMLILRRIPAPYLMLLAGLCYGPNPSLMTMWGGGESPLWYGAVGSFGMAIMFFLGAVFYGWRQRISWSFLLTRRASWRVLPWVFVSRLSFPMYVLAGAYVHYVVAGVTTALLPGIQMLATWLQRRRSRDPQPFSVPVLLACAIGLVGGLLCVLAQPSSDGGFYLFVEPVLAGFGVMLGILSMFSAAGQTCIYSFWLDNEEGLAGLASMDDPEFRWRWAAAVGDGLLGGGALVSGLIFLAAALLFGDGLPARGQMLGACANGLLSGFGMVLWSLGLCRSRSLASQVMLYAEPISVVGFAIVLGVASDLRLPLLLVSTGLVVASGVWAALIDGRVVRDVLPAGQGA